MPHILDEELYQAGMAIAGCPTAACFEGHVVACVLEKLKDLPHITTRFDEFGNLEVIYNHEPGERAPFRLVAHMDHPAFVVHRAEGVEEVRFAGYVEEKYFTPGKRIVFYNEKTKLKLGRAKITGIAFSGDVKRVMIDGAFPAEATFAMWDLPNARCTKKLFISPACDDLVEVSVMLALLRRLALSGAKTCVHALFTRAEEIAFAGALVAVKSKTPLAPMPVISLEASNARGFAKLDGGFVLRVGDRLSIFDSRLTNWMDVAVRDLQATKPGLEYQRRLMGGGTCEASVFQRAGWVTGALCVAMTNYHNMGPGTTIRAETISLRDWQGLYDFVYFLATEAKTVEAADEAVGKRFAQLEAKAFAALGGI